MLYHSVIFSFNKNATLSDKVAFFKATENLSTIAGIVDFQISEQVSQKNKFEFGISMKFNSQEDYDFYSNHAIHQDFIQNFWIKNVSDFLEIDFLSFQHPSS